MHGDRASERSGLQNHICRERYPGRAPNLINTYMLGELEEYRDRHNLYDIWKTTQRPKPRWELFKRFTGFTRGDVKRGMDLWLKTRTLIDNR